MTGAAGFIGSHLVAALKPSASKIVCFDSLRAGRWSEAHDQTEQITADLTERSVEELTRMLDGAEVLFHLAAEKYNSSNATPERILAVNIDATHRVFEAAANAGARVVFSSSLYAYGRTDLPPMTETEAPLPRTYYGMSKVAGEHMLRTLGVERDLRWSVARLFFTYGTHQHAGSGYRSVIVKNFERLRDDEPPLICGSGDQRLDYTYVSDATDALLRMTSDSADGELFNVASGAGTSINELTAIMLETAGKQSLVPVHGAPDWTEGTSRIGDPGKIRRVLGWAASTSWQEGLPRVAQEFVT